MTVSSVSAQAPFAPVVPPAPLPVGVERGDDNTPTTERRDDPT